MTMLDSLALTAMAVVLAALLHVSGLISLSLSPVAHAVTGVPVVQVQDIPEAPTHVRAERGPAEAGEPGESGEPGAEAVVSRR